VFRGDIGFCFCFFLKADQASQFGTQTWLKISRRVPLWSDSSDLGDQQKGLRLNHSRSWDDLTWPRPGIESGPIY